MPYELKGKKVLITGGSRGLGAHIATSFARAGSAIAINYNASAAPAEVLAKTLRQTYGVQVYVVQGDAGTMSGVAALVEEARGRLGGLDVVVGNAGWTKFATFGDLDALTEEDWDHCWSANVKAPLALMKAARPIFESNPEGGVLLITGSIAAIGPAGSSMAYSVTKAAQTHLMTCLAKTQGPKTRVNSVLPGLLLTEWGLKYSPEMIAKVKEAALLKQETQLEECAEMYVALARNTSMTGQAITVDSGLNIGRYQ